MRVSHHAFIVMYYAPRRLGYIADGSNAFINGFLLRCELRQLLGIQLIGIRFDQQYSEGFCGSSAALIAIAMSNCYKTNCRNKYRLTVGTPLRKRIIDKVHGKELADSKQTKAAPPQRINRQAAVYCRYCNKRFIGAARKGVQEHQEFCKLKTM